MQLCICERETDWTMWLSTLILRQRVVVNWVKAVYIQAQKINGKKKKKTHQNISSVHTINQKNIMCV